MVTIVFSSNIEGHFLEYAHHVYEWCRKQTGHYVFVLPDGFNKIKDRWDWIEANNISFEFFDNQRLMKKTSAFGQVLMSYRISKLVNFFVRKYKAGTVFALNLTDFIPSAPFVLSKSTSLCGIIYKIPIGENKKISLKNRLAFTTLNKFKLFSTVFVLNDEESADLLNRKYDSNKFVPIPDPYIPIQMEGVVDIRKQYGISPQKTLFVHFGAMNTNKATIDILKSLHRLSNDERKQYSFFFAGRVQDDIRNDFYKHYDELKDYTDVYLIDDYCSYVFFASLVLACNAILIPYRRVFQSSGLIGYASQFGRPVIAPNKGLLGRLVEKYKLGYLLEDCTGEELVKAYHAIASVNVSAPTYSYCEHNSVEEFQKVISHYL